MTVDDAPLISVVIPNYNGMPWLPACLESLAAQGFPPERMEICIVDDASADGSVAYLRTVHPEVRLLVHDTNAGFARTTNDGIRMARGAWIFLLNNDTVVESGCLAAAMAHAGAEPGTDWIACQLRLMEHPDRLDGAGDLLTIAGFARARGKYRPATEFASGPEPVFGGCAAAVLVRREVFDDVGLFEESFTAYLEDVDWSFRANLRGFRCRYLPQCQVRHRMGATAGTGSPYVVYHTSRNAPAMWLRNAPWPLFLASMPLHAVATLLQGALYLRQGTFRHFARGKWDFLHRIPAVLRARAAIQTRRTLPLGELLSRLDWHWFRTLVVERLRNHPPTKAS